MRFVVVLLVHHLHKGRPCLQGHHCEVAAKQLTLAEGRAHLREDRIQVLSQDAATLVSRNLLREDGKRVHIKSGGDQEETKPLLPVVASRILDKCA